MPVLSSPRSLFLPARVAFGTVLLMVFAVAASAYTVIFRDGRRVDVPNSFTVTQTTFTYEVAPGINRTVQMVLVDVAATERANNETPGSFLRRAEQHIASPAPAGHARWTLTNRDLEPIQQRRLESERAYEKRRVELGLPTLEETRRRQADEEQEVLALIRERRLASAANEAYWRQRASGLREEIVVADAEFNYLQSRLAGFRDFPLATHSLVTGVLPLGPLANRSAVVTPRAGNQRVYVAPGANSQFRGRVPLSNGNFRGQVLINPPRAGFRGVRPFGNFGFPLGSPYPFTNARPFDFVEGSYEQAGLVERLNDLQLRRATLAARWRQLEDEARDARVPQVWLEP